MKDIERGPDPKIAVTFKDVLKNKEATAKKLGGFLYDQEFNYGRGTVTICVLKEEQDEEKDAVLTATAEYGLAYGKYESEIRGSKETYRHSEECAEGLLTEIEKRIR